MRTLSSKGRTCTKCAQFQPWDAFCKKGDRRRPHCKTCTREESRAWRDAERRPKERPEPTQIRCRVCEELKPTSDFFRKSDAFFGRQTSCKTCSLDDLALRRKLAAEHPKDSDECYACGQTVGRGQLMLDHDHETLAFRGWACQNCNNGPLARRPARNVRRAVFG